MLIENNTLYIIDPDDVVDGVFTAPDHVIFISDNLYNDCIEKMYLPNVIEIGNNFLYYNNKLTHLWIPKVEKIGDNFLYHSFKLEKLDMPNIKTISYKFLYWNKKFNYTNKIIKSLKGSLIIGGARVDKISYLRKINLKKLLC